MLEEGDKRLLEEWNRTRSGYPQQCVHQLFEEVAERFPERVALRCAETSWSYRDLNARANLIAHGLRKAGVGREGIVSVEMERSPEAIAALLGILKAGGAYAPLDPADPPARKAVVQEELRAMVTLTRETLAALTDGCGEEEERNPVNVSGPDSLAYVLFTSGSTGAPKGVMVEHRGVVRLVRNTNYADLTENETFLQLAPLPFDAATFEIWGALLNGAVLAIPPAGPLSLGDIGRAISGFGVTTLWLTAGLFHAMVDQEAESLGGVRQLLAGGDVLSAPHARAFLDRFPGARLINGYGPTEGTTFTCCHQVAADHPVNQPVPIGKPVSNTTVFLLDEKGQPVPVGEVGELYAGGDGVARGYLGRPELTAERFVTDAAGRRLYRTGDLARFRPDGVLEFLGRADGQVKLRGFRIETGEIEAALNSLEEVGQSAVVLEECGTERRLTAYITPSGNLRPEIKRLRRLLAERLPRYMLPEQWNVVDALPLTANGKVDRQALPKLAKPDRGARAAHADGEDLEGVVAAAWARELGNAAPDRDTAFFDLGGSSLQLLRIQGRLERQLNIRLSVTDLFEHSTIRSLAHFLKSTAGAEREPSVDRTRGAGGGFAVIGMAGRWPGASSLSQFWENLKNGVESITFFRDEELEAGGGPGAVKARPILEGVDQFDAEYFGILPKEAETMDPQHRVFLECSVEALHDAGYDAGNYQGDIGVFAGCSPNTYFLENLCSDRKFIEDYTGGYQVGNYQTMLGTSPDFLSTRISYKLNLTGPSITLATACSTSLVAVAQACESLAARQCGMALAGGVSITFPQKRAYAYQEGGIASADGHCRAFDADAQGTVFGSGCGVVLLKRLEDALAEGDAIYAVIKGYGVNNDGAGKAGFTAPSVKGQAAAIVRAQEMAGVTPESITYLEAHGTGTPLGDPIEVAALTQAFRRGTQAKQFCALGTAKTNVGHLDAAAGVTGLIKAALSVHSAVLPPLLHFRRPNPRIDFADSPFYVNATLQEWKPEGIPRRAGVSSFGVGGTNAHLILEEAPARGEAEKNQDDGREYPLPLSARTAWSLGEAVRRLQEHRAAHPEQSARDVAWTLSQGRARLEHRAVLVEGKVIEGNSSRQTASALAFAFPGQGAQHPAMGRELYKQFPVFRTGVDECAELLQPRLGFDLRGELDAEALTLTRLAQPALFTVEYALAKLWMSWGIQPSAMLGHSVGEFVAATLAGVFSLADALKVVAERGRLMQELPRGSMLSVRLPETELRPLLSPDLDLAAINGPTLCVAAGPDAAVADLERRLSGQGVACRKLRTSHAFHSALLDPILQPLAELLATIRMQAPALPYISTLTGEWITAEQATDPKYWARHCRETVRFAAALQTLRRDREALVLEVGPGQALATLARQQGLTGFASLPEASSAQTEGAAVSTALGSLWAHGIEPDWEKFLGAPPARRVPVPAYAFERKRYWVEAPRRSQILSANGANVTDLEDNRGLCMPAAAGREKELRVLFEELSGMDLGSSRTDTSFLELGFDSLFLTQAAQALESRYKIKIRFAQLMDELSSLERLAAYLDRIAPAAPAVAIQPVAAPLTAARQAAPPLPAPPLGESDLARLMQNQLQAFAELTARQLETFRGSAPAPAAITAAPATVNAPAAKFESFGPYKPIQKGPAGGLTPRQAQYLSEFIRRYTARTAESRRQTQAHRAHLADPRVAAGFRAQWKEMVYPILMERSAGARMWDVDGNEYIDILNGFGVTLFGHAPDFVREAVARQLDTGIEIGPQTPLAGKVAELLCELTGLERATFCNTGSEAVMAAMRLARTVTGKNKVVFFTGDYHGAFDEVLVKSSARPGGPPKARPIAPGIPEEKAANVMVLEYGSPAALETIRAHASEIAAVLVEPVQSRHCNLRPVDFLRELRAFTKEADIALIFDEVVTGFRTHLGGAQALFGIRADLATYGKVIGGGLPIGALAGSARFMDALDGGMWQYGDESAPEVGVTFFAGTFVRHPLAMAACWAVLNHLKTAGPRLQEELSERSEGLVRRLNALFEEGGVPARIEHFRSIFYFGFPASERFAGLLHYHLRERGIHIQEGFPCFLTTAHEDKEVEAIVRAFADSIREMREAGFLEAGTRSAAPAQEAECLTAPLTEAQMEIRLSAQLGEEESCSYNEGFTIRLSGQLDRTALEEALNETVNRHEALRATLTEAGDALRIRPRLQLELPTYEGTEEDLRKFQIEDAAAPFDLVKGPLVRARLMRLGPEQHALSITAHHLICDGWSTNVLLEEFSALYTARNQGVRRDLPEPVRFSEYARAQAERRPDAEVEAYWVSEYAAPVPPLELPLDRPRPALKSYRGSTYIARIDAAETGLVRKAGAQCGATLFTTLLSGFQALLARLTGQSGIVVGIPSAGQSALAGQTLVGHCVNFLPIRAVIENDPTFKELLGQTRRKVLEAYEHQSYTYGTLVRKLAIPRNPSRLPLIEVQFNLERVGTNLAFGNLQARVEQNAKRYVNFDLFLNAVEGPDGITIHCDYNTDLFDETTIARWLEYYRSLLLRFAAIPETRLTAPPLLSESERRALLVERNQTAADYPRDRCVHQLIEAQAGLTPEAPAARCGDESLTYRQLNAQADALGVWLREQGAGPGKRVGIALEPSLRMLVAVLGVLKSGAAYVPLDPSYPQDRLDFIRQDADLALTLTSAGWPSLGESQEAPHFLAHADDLAYVMYTSGSTGKPKGVEVSHRALVNFLTSMRRTPGFESSDKLLAVTTLSFDIAGLELFLPLIAGGEVVLAGRDAARDGRVLAELLESAGITVMQATPTTWKMLLTAGWPGNRRLKALCGGEELTRELANQLASRCASLWNLYGPTETTIWSTLARVETGEGPVSIGHPIANTQIYLLDEAGDPVPAGMRGELYIGGDGLARGYRNRPDLTAEKFLPDPFRGSGSRMYRTGDLARYQSNGELLYLGRLDHQVKIRGHRIELGEIEAALLAQPGVRDAAVIVREDDPGEKRLAAYVVKAEGSLDHSGLRAALLQRIPDYMLPAAFIAVEALPLTPNGKIDRRALAELPAPAAGDRPQFAPPRPGTERALALIWEQVLRLERVGREDDLFALGADSIHLFQIASRAAQEGLALTPKQLMQYRTLSATAAAMDEEKGPQTEASAPKRIAPVSREKFRIERLR